MSPHRTRRVNALIKDLEEGDDYYREMAARRLGKLGDSRAVDALVDALDDMNNKIREAAAEALVELGDNRAVEILQSELKDNNISVQRRAAFSLISLKPDLETLKLLEEKELDEAVKKLRFNLVLDADRAVVSVQDTLHEMEARLKNELVDDQDFHRLRRGTRRLKSSRAVAKATRDAKLLDHVELALGELYETRDRVQGMLDSKRAPEAVDPGAVVDGEFMAELEKLMVWKGQGMLTDEEFLAAKQKLLGQ